MTELVSGASE